MHALRETNFHFANQTYFYRGKVRDVYEVGPYFISVATDRISAFDHILTRAIPYKGQVLNLTACHFLKASEDIIPNWLLDCPHANVSIGRRCMPIKVEMVIRGYLAGHAWREYKKGKRSLCGAPMPDGLRQSDAFPFPIITPATKAEEGHDEDITREEILNRGLVNEEIYTQMEEATRRLFKRGQEMARSRGLILVDTKYEFGLYEDKLYLIDEIHTPDSSRYFYAEGYDDRQARRQPQEQLSKEFVREWLMQHGFRGMEGQIMPHMPDDFVEQISKKYIELYELVTGKPFKRMSYNNLTGDIFSTILDYLKQ